MNEYLFVQIYLFGWIAFNIGILIHIGLIWYFQGYVMDGNLDSPVFYTCISWAWPLIICWGIGVIFYFAFIDYIDEMKKDINRDGSNYIGGF